MGFSQIAFPTIVLPKDDRTDSFQEERLSVEETLLILQESQCDPLLVSGVT